MLTELLLNWIIKYFFLGWVFLNKLSFGVKTNSSTCIIPTSSKNNTTIPTLEWVLVFWLKRFAFSSNLFPLIITVEMISPDWIFVQAVRRFNLCHLIKLQSCFLFVYTVQKKKQRRCLIGIVRFHCLNHQIFWTLTSILFNRSLKRGLIDLFWYVTLWKMIESYLKVVFLVQIWKKTFLCVGSRSHTLPFFRRYFESMTRSNGALASPTYWYSIMFV